MIKESLGHLAAPGVAHTDEQDIFHLYQPLVR